jgi:hypothetical protein
MGNHVLTALQQLVNDVEAMYRGSEVMAESGDTEEFFGPFSVAKSDGMIVESELEVSWPNLAISLREAKAALKAQV